MSGFLQDVRYALQQIRKNPGFAAIAVITLALGIGANTSIFSVVNGVLLRALPFHDPDRLVRVWHVPPQASFPGIHTFTVSPANYLDWKKQNDVFEQTAIYHYRSLTLTGGNRAEQVDSAEVSGDFFATLGIQPTLGRTFTTTEEDQPARANVVVLSSRFWQEHYGSNREIVGHTITVDGANYLVAGVMPPSFRFPDFAQMWTPLGWTDREKAVRGNHNDTVIARLKPGVDVNQAQAEMDTISNRLAQQYPEDDKGWGAVVVPLQADMIGDVRPALLVLFGAVGFVLLIACVNVANLSLARTFSRQKEISIRTTMGASSTRIVRQILAENVGLALIGGALGLILSHPGIRLIVAFLRDKLPASAEVRLSLGVLAFTVFISVLSGIAAGLFPALHLSKSNINQALKEGLGRTDSGTGGNTTRSALVVVEVSLSLVLLVGAGLMIRSFEFLQRVDPGFDSHGVLTMTAAVSRTRFSDPLRETSFFNQVLERVRTLPGVVSAGLDDDIPFGPNGSHQPIVVEGHPVTPMSEQPEVDVSVITSGYMSAMQVAILRGRDFSDADVAGWPAAVLISKSLAQQFWPHEDPIGKHITLTFLPGVAREVIGIVGDVKMDGLDQTRSASALYLPLGQVSAVTNEKWQSLPMTFVVRSNTNPSNLTSAVMAAIHDVDRDMPVVNVQTMDELVTNSLSQQRFNLSLLGAFAVLAMILAGIGIYGVLSYSVKRRVQEIGIRLALGATLMDVLRMVVLEAMRPTLLGVGIGAAGALALAKVTSSLLYGVRPTDPLTFICVAVILATVALLASFIPACRAAKVDPMMALRYE